jgi:hypothetical protein
MTTTKIPFRKIANILIKFVAAWIGVAGLIAASVLVAKIIVIYLVFIWNLWL